MSKRIFLNKVISQNRIFIEDKKVLHRLKNVLRLKSGDRIYVFDLNEKEYLAEIKELTNKKSILEILKEKENFNEPEKEINIFQAIIKKDNFEWVVEKGTEIGVSSLTPIITERVIKTNLNFERLEKISIEATEQSGRVKIPKINEIKKFDEAIKNLNGLNILLDPSGKPIKEIFDKIKESSKINVFIGPEGGFTEEEIELAKKENFEIINLGRAILKSESVCLVICSLILNI